MAQRYERHENQMKGCAAELKVSDWQMNAFMTLVMGPMLSVNAGFDREQNCIVEKAGSNVEHISGVALLDNHGVNLVSSLLTALVAPYVALGIWRHFV